MAVVFVFPFFVFDDNGIFLTPKDTRKAGISLCWRDSGLHWTTLGSKFFEWWRRRPPDTEYNLVILLNTIFGFALFVLMFVLVRLITGGFQLKFRNRELNSSPLTELSSIPVFRQSRPKDRYAPIRKLNTPNIPVQLLIPRPGRKIEVVPQVLRDTFEHSGIICMFFRPRL